MHKGNLQLSSSNLQTGPFSSRSIWYQSHVGILEFISHFLALISSLSCFFFFHPCYENCGEATPLPTLIYPTFSSQNNLDQTVRPAFLPYLLIIYYACWVEKFYFNIGQPTTATSAKLLIYSTLDPKNKFPKVV